MVRVHLIRAILVGAAGLMLDVPVKTTSETCRLRAVSQRESNTSSQPASVSFSADGRFLAFSSYARLAPRDTNDRSDIYVFDLATRTVTIETVLPDETQNNADSFHPDISDDGRFIVFESSGHLTSATEQQTVQQVLLRDRQLGVTRVLSINRSGELGNRQSAHAVISADGRVAAFESGATNLLPGLDANQAASDVYVVLLATQEIFRASVDRAGRQSADDSSFSPSISADGQLLAFTSSASLDREDTASLPLGPIRQPQRLSVFVRDLASGTTRRITRRDGGTVNGSSYWPAMSNNGRSVAFVSEATDFVRGDRNHAADVFVHDLETSTTTLISRSAGRGSANGASTHPAISGDGQLVGFESEASDLVCAKRCAPRDVDINLVADVFVFDRARGVMTRISADAESGWMERSRSPVIAGSGAVVAFSSSRPTDTGDRADDFDLFIREGCELVSLLP